MEVESTGQKTDEMTLEVVDVGYGVGGWRIEMGDEQDDTAGCNDGRVFISSQSLDSKLYLYLEFGITYSCLFLVLIDGKKVKHFIQKIDKTYQCQMCDHNSKDKSNLVRHLKRR